MAVISKEVARMELDTVQNEIHETETALSGIEIAGEAIKGAIVFKHIRCGKSSCRCMNGGPLHGPYPHLQWWEDGKLKTHYLNRKIYPSFAKRHAEFKRVEALQKKLIELKRKERRLIRVISSGR